MKKLKLTYFHCRKLGHIEKDFYNKTRDLEEKARNLEGDVSNGQSTNAQHRLPEGKVDKYTFSISTSQALRGHTSQSEWIVDFGCTHHMAKDASPFSSLSEAIKNKIFVVDYYALTIVGCVNIECRIFKKYTKVYLEKSSMKVKTYLTPTSDG
jgi:hypothetical protein